MCACRELRTVKASILERAGREREQDNIRPQQPCKVSFRVEGLLRSISHCMRSRRNSELSIQELTFSPRPCSPLTLPRPNSLLQAANSFGGYLEIPETQEHSIKIYSPRLSSSSCLCSYVHILCAQVNTY